MDDVTPTTRRKEELYNKFDDKRTEYIMRLSDDCPDVLDLTDIGLGDFFPLDGQRKYEGMKDRGEKVPAYCRILDNIGHKHRPLQAIPLNDPVYVFLVDLQSEVFTIATNLYESQQRLDMPDGTVDYFVSSKEETLQTMLRYFEERRLPRSVASSDEMQKDGLRMNQKRYEHILEIANESGPNKIEMVREFVDKMPDFYWDSFDWGNVDSDN
ncbi:hypothetical protein HOA92_06550 [archaeon]|jgi:hypothetical protein|nr:hypothetical protein [archaeon]